MDPHKLLDDAGAMTPAELVKFARENNAGMDGIETYALMLALITKLEWMIDQEAASLRYDFRRVADQLEDAELADRSADWVAS